ncbi:Regulator of chromosome condensation (RCC1) repeat [Phytophthora infestans]|uniref:Regulator of chromosome condensation (RCC1) repeat n=1 Tax=Phytophthora infestans TaxID=4787 RepID=A0A833SRS6_PHYIN|nr:Regulator of chromosome condensation (RCC1) repeat [Phytophthora infestans]KAF4128232.1 Regulator of chromosome condensation (RCC1) repeat [Phytophthora infestans]
MDPNHVDCYTQAQVELRELFHELECNGQVSAAELQQSLVPFTAGDVKRDLLQLLSDLKRKRQSLDEHEFLRVMWRKMYLASAIEATKSGAAGEHRHINVSLAHVIVSVKRRQQLRQFASYYSSRGISGADHLTSSTRATTSVKGISLSSKRSPVQLRSNKEHSSSLQQTEQLTGFQPASSSLLPVMALRRRCSPCYDVVACVYDADLLQMRTRTLLSRARGAEVRNCSQLYCLLFTKEAGNFVLASTHFGENAKRNYIKEKDEYGITEEAESDLGRAFTWSDRDDQGLLMVRMEEVGLRNVVAAASSRASFAASTGRKLHQWRAQEPYRVLEDADSETLVHQQLNISDTNNEGDDEENQLTSAGVRLLDTDPPGDCFGLLGGKPLLARTKTIADVGDLRQIAAGEHFLMATSSSGELYSWESSSSSTAPPIGRGYVIPERVPWFHSPEKVFRVACGSHHTLVLTSSGVYAWGSNVYGQLGLGAHCSPADPHTLEPAPVRIPTDDMPVLDIACGDMHSVALTAGGQVLTFGCNWEGQLGFNEQSNAKIADVVATGCAYEPLPVLLPQEPDIDKKVYLITAGPQTTAVVGTSGRVFQWGRCVPDGLDGVCGRVSRRLPESLDAVSEYEGTSGPVWHSIAIADGLVTLTRHATATSAVSEDPTALKR